MYTRCLYPLSGLSFSFTFQCLATSKDERKRPYDIHIVIDAKMSDRPVTHSV